MVLTIHFRGVHFHLRVCFVMQYVEVSTVFFYYGKRIVFPETHLWKMCNYSHSALTLLHIQLYPGDVLRALSLDSKTKTH